MEEIKVMGTTPDKLNEPEVKKCLVVMNGWNEGFGTRLYFVGLFNTADEAMNAIDKCVEFAKDHKVPVTKENYSIIEVDEGWWHYPKKAHYLDKENACTDIFLGGYTE